MCDQQNWDCSAERDLCSLSHGNENYGNLQIPLDSHPTEDILVFQ